MMFLKIKKSEIDFLKVSRVPKVCTNIEQANNVVEAPNLQTS